MRPEEPLRFVELALQLVEAVVPDLMSSLVTKSLLLADLERAVPRYRLLEPFRACAGERLAARGEYHSTAHRHALICIEQTDRFVSAGENEPSSGYRTVADASECYV